MFVVIAILIGLIIGFIRGGSVGSIFNHLYKKWYLGLAGVVMLILLHYAFLVQPIVTPIQQYLPIFNFIAYILVLLMLIFNLDDFYTILISVGVTLNFIVTFINSGYMPVADAVLSQIPINYPLAQSIYTGMNGIYALMQPQTLLSFLGVFIPFPILQSFLAMVGSLPGFSIGDILLLVGLAGVLQSSMVLSKTEPQIVTLREENENRVRRKANPVTTKKRPEHFESRTEELFFEDAILPEDPLDKIFGGEPEKPTKIIEDLSDINPVNTGSYQIGDDALSVDDLTRPLGTGIINSKEVERKLREQEENPEPLEPLTEEEGFFASSYLSGKDGTGEVSTAEIFKDTNIINDVKFVTNDIEIQTAEIVVDEGEKPVYKPTQEKLEKEKQAKAEQSVEMVPVQPVITIEPEKPKEEVRRELIDKTPIPKAPVKNVQPVNEVQAPQQPVIITPEPIETGQDQVKAVSKEVIETAEEKTTTSEPKVVKPKEQTVEPAVVEEQEKTASKEIKQETVQEEVKEEPVESSLKEQEPKVETKPEKVVEEPVVEVEEEQVEPVVEEKEFKPEKKFGIEPGNFLYLSSQLKHTQKFVPDERLAEENNLSEPTQELTAINDIFFDYDQYQLLLNSIKDEGLRRELENTFKNYSKSKLKASQAESEVAEEEIKPEEPELKPEEPEKTEEEKLTTVEETVTAPEPEELEVEEVKETKIKEVYVGGPTSSIKEHEEQLQEEKLKEEAETADEEEITDIINNDKDEAPKLRDLLLKEKPVVEVESTTEEEVTEEAEEVEASEETETGEAVEETTETPEETLQESEEEVLQAPVETTETLEEETEGVEETSEEEPVEFLPVIDWNSFANLILEDERGLKRGSYVQGNDGGYFVNKAYKEERSKMDKSEERMMNVWSNLSKENQQRKLERRKQATGSYFNQAEQRKPAEPEEVVETEVKEVEKQEKPLETAPMSETERVNQMTDEEREKAGYEKVTINFQGNEISFWQKKVKE